MSDIYEIFLSKRLFIENGNVKDAIKSEYTKTKGAVSTPQYIVQEIIKRTILKSKIENAGIEQIFNHKILDIACGSGVFAIEVYDYLEDIFIELFASSKNPSFQKYFVETKNGEIIVNLLGKKAIMDNCIFGVDIDPEAVEVAKMSLSLKIVDTSENLESYNEMGIFGSKILRGIGNNIRCGNSLVESDILTLFPSIQHNEEELIKTNVFDWSSEHGFKAVFEQKSGFDYIVGNPPYVEVKHYNEEMPYMHQYIKLKYVSSKNGKIDLAIPFIEKAIALLNPSGRMGFIVQKRFFKTEYGKKIREIITSSNLLSSVIDFETTTIFKDRIIYVSILVLDKVAPKSFSFKLLTGKAESLASQLRELNTPDISSEHYSNLPSSAFDANPWSFDDAELIAIKTKLLALGCLGDYANVKVGIQVLWDKAYHIRPIYVENGLIKGKSHIDNDIEIEEDACRQLICNENFYPYRSDKGDVFVIFPYTISNRIVSEIPFTDFKKKYPKAGQYLEKHKENIQKNVETKEDTEGWHLYTRVQNHGAVYPKILIPMTALDTFATVIFDDKTYCDNANVFFIEATEKYNKGPELYALSAVINSTIFSVLARSIANPQTNGYFKFNKQFLEPVPFPCAIFAENMEMQKQLDDTSSEIEALQNRFRRSSPNQKRNLGMLLAEQWRLLDDLCYELYGLKEAEKTFFNNRGRNVDRVGIL